MISKVKKRRWGYYKYKTKDRITIELLLGGVPGMIFWSSCFDKRGGGTRLVFDVAFDIKKFHYSVMFQHYREGYDFDNHTDGVAENKVISILLHKPREGGKFFTQGPQRSWLRERIWYFDGGRYHHGVTKIIKGSRTVLMLQKGCR